MLRAAVSFSLFVVACGGTHAKPLSDGSFAIECEAQKVCLDRAERQCGSAGYQIIDGQHEQKLAGVPGNEKLVGVDHLHIRCKPGPFGGTPQPPASEASAKVQTQDAAIENPPSRVTPTVCRPGETQKCVGPGACAGGQACKADGSGFDRCDCGDTK